MAEQAVGTMVRPCDIAVYARRKARMAFLLLHLDEGHPVVVTESHLIEMAASKLREKLMSDLGESGMVAGSVIIESEIRNAMRKSVSSFVSDNAGRDKLLSKIDEEPLGLFTSKVA